MMLSMKTNRTQGHLLGLSFRFGVAALTLAFAASGFAHPTSGSSKKTRTVRSKMHKDCYVILTSSPFPQPADRLGSSPSTASPMSIIGESPVMHCRR